MRQKWGRVGMGQAFSIAAAMAALAASACGAGAGEGSRATQLASSGATPAPHEEPPSSSPPATEAALPVVSDEASPAPADAEDDAAPRLYAFDGFEKIFQKPDTKSPLIGLVHAGQSVKLTGAGEVLKGPGVGVCKGGFYAVVPRGFVCTGLHSTPDRHDARFRAAREVLPDTSKAMPFRVGVMIRDAPQYRRIPTPDEQRKLEPELDKHLAAFAAGTLPLPKDAVGSLDTKKAGVGPSRAFSDYLALAKPALTDAEPAFEGRKMAFTRELDAEGRTFLVTPDLTLVPKDKVRFVEASSLKGVALRDGEMKFPFGYTWIEDTAKLTRHRDGTFVETGDVYPRHSFVQLEGQLVRGKGGNYWKTADGSYVRNELVSVFKKRGARPSGVGAKDKWIEVRITWGTLVAYEGDEPVFATAISPGQDGVSQRAHGHTTKRGTYTVGWKLVAADMSGVEKSKPWAVDEVPFVSYYKDSYALHAAWWHDDFGRPKSHGCVNLAPADAQFMWRWVEPNLPDGWWAVAAFHPEVKGTTVVVSP